MNNNILPPKPKNPNNPISQFEAFVELVQILRNECPWDRKQTNESIAPLLIEETYETIDAIHTKDDAEFSKELGDLLLHIVMHAIMAQERNAFDLALVIDKISKKMIYRHPHIFGDISVSNVNEVLENWEKLKKTENSKEIKRSTLEGVPNSLPSLLRAERIQHKVSKVGFDWKDKNDVWNKVEEELKELKYELTNNNKEKARQELGDFIFAIVNAARHEGIVAEEALYLTNNKFINRFKYIESKAEEMGKELDQMTLEEMDKLWDEAKIIEKENNI